MKVYQIPKTRDPFINALLIHAGFDPETGMERFWCSSWNDNIGSIGALIRADGKAQIYRFEKAPGARWAKCGFYTALMSDNDTLWLIGDVSLVCRLTLSTGEVQEYPTGLQPYLQGRGSVYDPESGKICYGNFVPPRSLTVIFDTKSGTVCKVIEGGEESLNSAFPNGDGTYTLNYCCSHTKTSTFKRWDPKTDAIEEFAQTAEQNVVNRAPDCNGLRYLDGIGWLGADGSIVQGPTPPIEGLTWSDSDGRYAVGCDWNLKTDKTKVWRWDMESGEMKEICTLDDTPGYAVDLTRDGGIAALSVYGVFVRYDAEGNKLVESVLDSDSIGMCDCILRADERTIVGTPFITQRFWTLDTESGIGCDRGRATAGVGEVMRAWNLGGKVYMASYTEGQITEFDPKKGGNFPENPRVVAQPKHSMRPTGAAQSETTIYSAATHHYGEHGFELTAYNTVTGEAMYKDDPIPNQQMLTLYYNQKHHVLIGATDANSDCGLSPRVENHGVVALIDPESLEVLGTWDAPSGDLCLVVLGPKDEDSYYIASASDGYDGPIYKLGVFDLRERKLELVPVQNHPHYGCTRYAGIENKFVVREGEMMYVCRGEGLTFVKEKCLGEMPGVFRYFVSGGELFAHAPTKIFVEKI